MRPVASEMLGFFLIWADLRSGDVWRREWMRFSKSGVDVSTSAEKSGMLSGRDMAGNEPVEAMRWKDLAKLALIDMSGKQFDVEKRNATASHEMSRKSWTRGW
jgi:hypothetical protein